MEGRRVLFKKDNKVSGLHSQSCANRNFSVGSRKTKLSDSASSFLTGGRRKCVNTGSVSTPTTNLSTSLIQPIPAVDADLQEQERSCEISQSDVGDDDRDKTTCERKQLRTIFCHKCHSSKIAAKLTHVYLTTRSSKSEDNEAGDKTKCDCEQLAKISCHKCHCSPKSAQLSQEYPTARSSRTDAGEGNDKSECEHLIKIFNHKCHCSTNSAQLVYATIKPEFTCVNNQSTESHQAALENYSMGSLFKNDNTERCREHFECQCKKKSLQKTQTCSLLDTTNNTAPEVSYCTLESSCHHFNKPRNDSFSTQGSSTNDAKQGRLDLRSEVNCACLTCQVSGCVHHDSNGQTSSPRLKMAAQNEDNTNSASSRHISRLYRQKSEPTMAPCFRRQLRKCKSDAHKTLHPRREVGITQVGSSDDGDDFHSLRSFQDKRSEPCTPTSPSTGHAETSDPYQIFEVQHSPCLILTVRVLQGRNITLGFQDLYDIPDPYINLTMRSSPEGRKSTTVKVDEPNPVWNETFTFFINFTQANVLEISLMESNSYWFDQLVGTVYYDIVNIRDMDKPQTETFVFNEISEVDIEFKLEFDRHPTLRYSLCLSYQEKMFIKKRKEQILEAMRNLLGNEDGPQNVEEVPTIAVIGSGGGFRAMTGYSGVFKALVESGVLSCTMYACGLSGSSWLLSTLYSHPKWPNLDMGEFLDELKNNIDKSLLRFLNAKTMYSYLKFMIEKRREGQPVSFTDIFGRMVGETLLADRMETTLTDQREVIKDGAVPMPLYTCVHVKKDVPARSFQEWVEFSPYEIGMPKYGTFMDAELFGSKFFMGKLVKQYKEQPLHFLQGIWGSAFCILFRRLLEENHHMDPTELVREEMGDRLDEDSDESSSDCSEDEFDDCSMDSTESLDNESCSAQNSRNIARSARNDVATDISTPWRIYQILKPQLDDMNIEEASQEVDGVIDTGSSDVCDGDTEENTDLESIENGNDIIVNGNIDISSSCDADEEDDDDVDEVGNIDCEQTRVEVSNGTMETKKVNSEQKMVEGSNGTMETSYVNSEHTMVEGSDGTVETRYVNSEHTMVEGSNGTIETREVNSEQIMVEGLSGTIETRNVNSEHTMVDGSNGTIETREVNSEQIMVDGLSGTIETRNVNSEHTMVDGSNGTMETREVNSEHTMVDRSNGTIETREVNSEQIMVEGLSGTIETRNVNSEHTMVDGSNGTIETREVNSEQIMVDGLSGTIETRNVNSEHTMVDGSNRTMETREVNSEHTMVEGSNGTMETREVNSEHTMVEGSNGTMETREVNSEHTMVEGSNGTMETREVNSEHTMVEGSNGTMETREVNSEHTMVEGSNGTMETREVNSEQMLVETYKETQEEILPQQSLSHSVCEDKDSFLGQAVASQSPSMPQSSHELSGESLSTVNGIDLPSDCKKHVNWGNCPTIEAKDRRKAYKSCTSVRKSKSGSRSFWKQFLKGILESNSWELLSTRRGRAAVIHNFMRGLSLQQSYPLSPFTTVDERVDPEDEFGIFEMHPTSVKHIYMVDAGLAFNSPYPLILRPQRAVDIILSFDFSARPSDSDPPFKELLLAEKWARLNRLPFPPIDTSVFDKDNLKELYIFRHPTDNNCPIVFHFVLVNEKFKLYKKPDIPRETKEEFEFAEFQLFDDPRAPYSTFNFTYSHTDFERLSQLTEFNTLLHIGDIKEVIKEVIKTKREAPPRLPVQPSDIELLRMKEQQKMQQFISQMEHRNSIHGGSHPSTPFQTPTSHVETHTNPFFAQNQNKASQNQSNGNSSFNSQSNMRMECFCRNICRQKNLHRANLYKSGKHNPGPITKKVIARSYSLPSNSPDVGITHSTPSITPEHPLQDQQVGPSNGSESAIIQKEDVNERRNDQKSMPLSENITLGPEFNNSCVDTSVDTMETTTAIHSCPETVSDSDSQQNINKKLLLLQKLKLGTEEFTPSETIDQTCTSSGYGSPGSKMDTSWDRTNNPEVNMENSAVNSPKIDIFSIDKTSNSEMNMASLEINPSEIVNFSIDKTSSANLSSDNLSLDNTDEMFKTKVKSKKDQIPNPFFAKAYFMRSPHNSACSSKSPCDTVDDTGDDTDGVSTCEQTDNKTNSSLQQSTDSVHKTETPKLVGRLSSRTSRPSPLIITSNNKEFSTDVLSSSSETSPDTFTLAPEALKADGMPVFDSQEAKMIYESFKNKRKARPSSSETSPDIFALAPEALKADGTPVFDSQEAKMIYESFKNKRKAKSSSSETSPEIFTLAPEAFKADGTPVFDSQEAKMIYESFKNKRKAQSSSSETSPEIFTLAPEAFKADGTPVFDSQEAKMFYESVKNKRKLFHRQSTVSSLNSISLNEYEPFCGEIYASNNMAECKAKSQ